MITIRHQKHKSLALQLIPDGVVVLVPHGLSPESDAVQQFIADAFAKLPAPPARGVPVSAEQIYELVREWSAKLGVTLSRVQIRTMRNKWGSISTAGTLTLADDLLTLPVGVVEYVIVHELLHLKFPDHRQGWQVSMGIYLPDWRARSEQLAAYTLMAPQE